MSEARVQLAALERLTAQVTEQTATNEANAKQLAKAARRVIATTRRGEDR